MAFLDTQNNQIVIRLVYDGPPMSGKTTSVKALAGSLSQDVYTPEEIDGRTLYFDWLDYTGGLFEGRQIRCQIVSVPGQGVLAPRRRRILETADAVIFVGDSTRGRIDESVAYLRSLVRLMKAISGPPVGLIFQANKRDQPDVADIAQIKTGLGKDLKDVGIIESVATEGTGIRQAFVFGVRLSLDRVREYIRTDSLPQGVPDVASGQEFLDSLRSAERSALLLEMSRPHSRTVANGSADSSIASAALGSVLDSECPADCRPQPAGAGNHLSGSSQPQSLDSQFDPPSSQYALPLLPSASLPAGLIWPPVEGRISLLEALQDGLQPEPEPNGDWTVTSNKPWRLHSYATAIYPDINQAQQALLQWAHLHLAVMPVLSPRRCLAVAESEGNKWRLWQVIREESSLRDSLNEFLPPRDVNRLANGLWGAVYLFLTGLAKLPELPRAIPYNLSTMSCIDWDVVYNGLMPHPQGMSQSEYQSVSEVTEGLKEDLKTILEAVELPHPSDRTDVLNSLRKRVDGSRASRLTYDIVCELLES